MWRHEFQAVDSLWSVVITFLCLWQASVVRLDVVIGVAFFHTDCGS